MRGPAADLRSDAKLDEPAKRRVVEALVGTAAPLDTRRIGRLEQELRALALDNAFGRVGDDDYLRRKGALTAELGGGATAGGRRWRR